MSLDTIISFKEVPIFQKDNLVLSDVTFGVEKGEFLYIIGKTGTGKSSLLKTIYAELPVTAGEATVVDYDLRTIKRKDIPFLRRKLGIIFQDFQLLTDRSVHENLLFIMKATGWKDKNKIEERIQDVLVKTDLSTVGFKMPHQLSGGEQQRLGIARALINDPEVVLADEPTGNLDPETSHGIMELLFEISKSGRAVIMATHDYSLFVSYKAKTMICEGGKLISS
jgi:cell division transport system ATP-binding protein